MKPSTKTELSKENELRLNTIASFLKNYRILSGLTQEQISKYADLNRSSIIRLEKGLPVSFITICKYASGIDLPLNQLFLEID